jgi:hypothetical protein
MGGESAEAWRTVLDDLVKRGLRRPEFLIVDGAPGLDKAIASVWDGVPVQRCIVRENDGARTFDRVVKRCIGFFGWKLDEYEPA